MKTGIVLEGGAMRGLYTCGVLDVFMENGIEFDGANGVSAGACFGFNLKSKQAGRAIRYNIKYCQNKRYCSINSLIKTGNFFETEFCYYEIPMKLDPVDFETFKNNPMDFFVTCTDLNTGKPVYYKLSDSGPTDMAYIRASASMPLASTTVRVSGKELLDGGVADSIPIRHMQKLGYDKIVIILTQPKGYVKKKNKAMPLIRFKYRKYKEFIKACENRHIRYNETLEYIEELEEKGEVLVIRPSETLPMKRVEKDPKKLMEAYEIGRSDAMKLLDDVKEFLGKN